MYATYCGSCEQECDVTQVDGGIGHYEFWGRLGIDRQELVWRSTCCEGIVYADRECNIEYDDWPDHEADRADHENDDKRAGYRA